MVEVYVTLIIAKKRTIGSVPAKLKGDVIAALKERGYDEDGNPVES